MKKHEIITSLREFGLSNNEALVYLSILSLGPSSVQNIAKNSKIKRTTVYSILENLKEKGLVITQVVGLKKMFTAEKPNKLINIIEQKKERLIEVLPELNALNNLETGESFIKYYEGINGVLSVYDNITDGLKNGDDYLIISNMEKFLDINKSYFEKHIKKRSNLKLNTRAILVDNTASRTYRELENKTKMKIKFLQKNINLTANLVILPTKVIITQLVNPIMCIIIENKSIVQMQKEQFEIIWKSLK
jgi:sugar-specific transcriptional regulator TrmB